MAITVAGTTITFNDGTVQSTAASAVTTTSVLNATAGASVGSYGVVGTYAFLDNRSGSAVYYGNTKAGSLLYFSPAWGDSAAGPAPAGTWRCLGSATAGGAPDRTTLWLRIS